VNLPLLDPYRDGDSPIHNLDSRVKLLFTLAFIVAVNLTPIQAWPAHLAYLLGLIGIGLLARVGMIPFLARSMVALPFVLMAALGTPWVHEGTGLMTVRVASYRLVITDAGLLRFAGVLARSWLSVLAAVTLVLTTRFVSVVKAMGGLGVPAVLTSTILLAYRYIHLLIDEALRMMRAREARSAEPEQGVKGRSLLWRARVTGGMIGALFLRTYDRSERIYYAMLARGFCGEIRTLQASPLPRAELTIGGLAVAALVAMVTLAHIYW